MTQTSQPPLSHREDEGSALILVLMVVLFAGVVTGAVLQFAGAGLKIAPQARDLRNQSTYLQGAVDGAINNIRNSTFIGSVNGPACPTYAPQVPSDLSGATGQVFSVSCSALPVTGGAGGGPDQPSFAILTLGTGTDGLKQINGNDVMLIDGGVFSHGVITGPTGPQSGMEVNGSIYAEGVCANKISSTDPLFSFASNCNYSPPGSFGDDPQYTSGVADASALTSLIGSQSQQATGADPIPTCSGGYTNFSPGYYSVTPKALKDDYQPGCSNSFAFSPGVYYFDYSGTWAPDTVIAGTRVGPTCNQSASGAQFVFGGSSQVLMDQHAHMEICPPVAGQGVTGLPQRIAIYGLSAGNPNNATSTPVVQTATLKASAVPTSTGQIPFLLPPNAQYIGESPTQTSTAILPEKKSAVLSYSAFDSVPKGATITSLKARVVSTMDAPITATLTASTSPSHQLDYPIADNCAGAGCSVNLLPFITSGDGVPWRDLNQLSLDLKATTGNNQVGTATVDGIELQISYTPPVLKAQTCAGCDFFTSGVQNDVLVHGTVYTPSASWNVDLHNKNSTAFDRGVIVRNLQTSASASYKQLDAPFSLPKGTPTGRLVLFRGSVGPDSAHLTELLRACVLYTDVVSSAGASGPRAGYGVTVRRWSLLQTAAGENPDCH